MILGIRLYKDDAPNTASIVPIAFPLIAGAGTMTSLLSLRAEFAVENIIVAIVVNILLVYIVLKLSVSLEIIKKRINERQTLEKRTDDNEHTAIKRYETYENKIKPVVDFYKQSNLLKVVNGENSITEISNEISDLIDGLKG